MECVKCPNCGERLVKDKVFYRGLVYAERLRCFKCGFWETRALSSPRGIQEGELISRQAAIELCDWYEHEFSECDYAIKALADDLKSLPTAEPRQGVWKCEIKHYCDKDGEFDYKYIYCSECGEQRRIGWSEAKYCPNCGARMTEA